MLNRCAVRCTEWLGKHCLITEEEEPIYVYGFELSISTLLSLTSILLLSLIIGHPGYALFFLLFFFTVRLFCGGYHASTYVRCFIITNSIFVSTVVLTEIVLKLGLTKFMPILFAISAIIVFIFSPVRNENHPCSEKTFLKNKRISRCLSCSYLVLYMIMFFLLKSERLLINSAWSFIWVSIMIVIEKIKQRKEER